MLEGGVSGVPSVIVPLTESRTFLTASRTLLTDEALTTPDRSHQL
jgi:hypothetical protein